VYRGIKLMGKEEIVPKSIVGFSSDNRLEEFKYQTMKCHSNDSRRADRDSNQISSKSDLLQLCRIYRYIKMGH
jgi:hypothetical protein